MDFATKFAFFLMGFLGLSSLVKSVPNTTVMSRLCNGNDYTSGDPFGISLAYVVDDLESGTPTSKNYVYSNISPYPNAFAYGHASCNQNLTGSDCKTCVSAATTGLLSFCPNRIGARAQLHDCQFRYEQYPFSG